MESYSFGPRFTALAVPQMSSTSMFTGGLHSVRFGPVATQPQVTHETVIPHVRPHASYAPINAFAAVPMTTGRVGHSVDQIA